MSFRRTGSLAAALTLAAGTAFAAAGGASDGGSCGCDGKGAPSGDPEAVAKKSCDIRYDFNTGEATVLSYNGSNNAAKMHFETRGLGDLTKRVITVSPESNPKEPALRVESLEQCFKKTAKFLNKEHGATFDGDGSIKGGLLGFDYGKVELPQTVPVIPKTQYPALGTLNWDDPMNRARAFEETWSKGDGKNPCTTKYVQDAQETGSPSLVEVSKVCGITVRSAAPSPN